METLTAIGEVLLALVLVVVFFIIGAIFFSLLISAALSILSSIVKTITRAFFQELASYEKERQRQKAEAVKKLLQSLVEQNKDRGGE